MIYEATKPEEPIKQGDIFFPLPLTITNIEELKILRGGERIENIPWKEVTDLEKSSVILPIKQACGIVASQDCDTAHSLAISFFVIRPFSEFKQTPPVPIKPEWLIKQIRKDEKFFYLPKDETIGFTENMFVDLEQIFQVSSAGLHKEKGALRKGRLNYIADEHFRETIAQFFRRYPYNEWYPLTKEQFEEYAKKNKEIDGTSPKPHKWQE